MSVRRVNITLELSQWEWLRKYAFKNYSTVSGIIKVAVEEFILKIAKNDGKKL